ncbi:MAG TPA: hypothetical protein VGG75_15935 [Trebonia sp.]|jgi:hypothetical protein
MHTTDPIVRRDTAAALRLVARHIAGDEHLPVPRGGFTLYVFAGSREEVIGMAEMLGVPVTTERTAHLDGKGFTVRVTAARNYGAVRYAFEWITVEDKSAKAA